VWGGGGGGGPMNDFSLVLIPSPILACMWKTGMWWPVDPQMQQTRLDDYRDS